jgi:hypothetical protein
MPGTHEPKAGCSPELVYRRVPTPAGNKTKLLSHWPVTSPTEQHRLEICNKRHNCLYPCNSLLKSFHKYEPMRQLLSRSLTLYTNYSYDEASRCIQMNCNILQSVRLIKTLNKSAAYSIELVAHFDRNQWSKYLVITEFHPWSVC